ncbi:MAG TPA: cysteine desulfurase CsdA [Flavobacteriaceae bacterium]|nr:cysteine desulfurase CsdA [Flavobacteriaceae bacterium]
MAVGFDIDKIRADFPILLRQVHNKPLIYFDNAATSQKPKAVIDALVHYYTHLNANIHRGVHALSQEATDAYEQARDGVKTFFNAQFREEIIFTAGTTHSINIVAHGFRSLLNPGDEIIVGQAEHHSNIVPWQMACDMTGAVLKVLPIDDNGQLQLDALQSLLGPKTQLVVVNHVSNALGTINPIEKIIEMAHQAGAKVLIDGAQASSHIQVDVSALNVDFYTTSAHKMCGPTGVGMLYGKKELLELLPPYQGGGEMIKEVYFQGTTYAGLPHKFEAGTPNIAGGIGFGAAIEYLNEIGLDEIAAYEHDLLLYATEELKQVQGLRIYGDVPLKTAVISFNIEGLHPYDVGTLLDQMGIAVRTGQHCAQPVMDFYGIPGTVRASFAFYNTKDEIDTLVKGVKRAVNMLL